MKVPHLALMVALVATSAGCGEKAAPAAAPPPKVIVPDAPPPAPLSDEMKQKLDTDFAAARELVASARSLKGQGDAAKKTGGKGAGRDFYIKAAPYFTSGIDRANRWCEPNVPGITVTDDQRARLLKDYVTERDNWVKEAAQLGPLIQGF